MFLQKCSTRCELLCRLLLCRRLIMQCLQAFLGLASSGTSRLYKVVTSSSNVPLRGSQLLKYSGSRTTRWRLFIEMLKISCHILCYDLSCVQLQFAIVLPTPRGEIGEVFKSQSNHCCEVAGGSGNVCPTRILPSQMLSGHSNKSEYVMT